MSAMQPRIGSVPATVGAEADNQGGWEALRAGRLDEAERAAEALMGAEPSEREGRGLLGAVRAYQGDAEGALRLLAKAQDRPEVYSARARALERLGELNAAESALRRGLVLAPGDPDALTSLGSILARRRRHADALDAFGRALAVDPDHAPAHVERARLRVTLGDARGWSELDWRLKVPGAGRAFPPVGPAWDGGPVRGTTMLLVAEDDPADQIQFVRYAGALAGAGARVVLGCRPESAALLGRADGVARVVTDLAGLDEPVDAHAYLMSLPSLAERAGEALATVPRPPYLRAEASAASRWAAELAAYPGLKIAVHWGADAGDRRSFAPSWLGMLAEVPGVRLVSIQPPEGPAATPGFPTVDLGPRLGLAPAPLDETAAVLAGVSLLVTDDAPVAHLAGALGVPAWVALPAHPDWHWAGDRPEDPWYPSLTLFRQSTAGDWSPVFQAMSETLWAGSAGRAG